MVSSRSIVWVLATLVVLACGDRMCAEEIESSMFAYRSGKVAPDFYVGKKGSFKATSTKYYQIKVEEVIDKNTMLVSFGLYSDWIVKGWPTRDLADGARVELKGDWKITSTKKHGGRTYFVVEPIEAKK